MTVQATEIKDGKHVHLSDKKNANVDRVYVAATPATTSHGVSGQKRRRETSSAMAVKKTATNSPPGKAPVVGGPLVAQAEEGVVNKISKTVDSTPAVGGVFAAAECVDGGLPAAPDDGLPEVPAVGGAVGQEFGVDEEALPPLDGEDFPTVVSTDPAAASGVGLPGDVAPAVGGTGVGSTQGQSNVTPAVGGGEEVSDDDVDMFLKQHIVPFLDDLQNRATSSGKSMAQELLHHELAHLEKNDEVLSEAFKQYVPWGVGAINFHTVPSSSRKGKLHISMLSFHESSYAANGLYLGDAKMLLSSQGFMGLKARVIHVRPRTGQKQTVFGWEPDGAMINSTYSFIYSSIIIYHLKHAISVMQPLAHFLQNIPVIYNKCANNEQRIIQSLVDSAAQRYANRTVQCPVFLAQELKRGMIEPKHIRAVVKLYRQRVMITPALDMPQRMEDVLVRFMSQDKVSTKSMQLLSSSVAKHTWGRGPWKIAHFLATGFTMGSCLNNSCQDDWAALNIQSAAGQLLALTFAEESFAQGRQTLSPTDDWETLLIASGLWVNVKEKLLPSLMLDKDELAKLDEEFTKDSTFREDLAKVAAKDPPASTSAVGDIAGWVLKSVSALKRAKQASIDAAQAAGRAHPSKLMGDQEAADLNAFNYSSSCALDVESYRKAMLAFAEESTALEENWKLLRQKHVSDLLRLHDVMQKSDLQYWEAANRRSVKRHAGWLSDAVQASVAHRRALKVQMGIKDADILQVNVFALYALGTVKLEVLNKIAVCFPRLPGLTLLFYPIHPKRTGRSADLAAVGATPASGDALADQGDPPSESDSDMDPDMHDYNADGQLPEALTSMHSVKTTAERAAQLSLDSHVVDTQVCLSNIDEKYPKWVHFLHAPDGSGERSTTLARVLVPTHPEPGVNLDSLGESVMFRGGSYMDAPNPSTFINVSRKAAAQATRMMAEDGKFEKLFQDCGTQRGAGAKVSRGQLGSEVHDVWLRDIIKTCGTKALYVCDFAHGAGEVGRAAISSKVSVEATGAGVRVCLFAHDPRKVFASVGRAVGRTEMSKQYMSGKLVVPGHTVVPDPGAEPCRSRALVTANLQRPLKVLTIDKAGRLLIPDASEVAAAVPVPLSAEHESLFNDWRKEFPRPPPDEPTKKSASAGDGNGSSAGGGGTGTGGGNGTSSGVGSGSGSGSQVSPGMFVSDLAKMKSEYGDEIVSEQPLPEGGTSMAVKWLKLALAKNSSRWRVWIHNTHTTKDVPLPALSYLGKGGPGAFLNPATTQLEASKVPYGWRFTRYTQHKKDVSEHANGYFVFNKDGGAVGGKPKLQAVADIEKELGNNLTLYGHSITRGGNKVTITPAPSPVVWVPTLGEQAAVGAFTPDNLGQFVRSYEDVSGATPKCTGLHRPVFEVRPAQTAGSTSAYVLQPTSATRNPVWLFTKQKVEIPAGGYVCLG